MPKFKFISHLQFNRSEQGGILFLAVLLMVLIAANGFLDFSEEPKLDLSSPTVRNRIRQLDSLRAVAIEERAPKLYPFNPNFISDYKAYALGMTPEEFERLKVFRSEGKWINSKEDFKTVTQVSVEWLDSIAPFFKFPDWVNTSKPRKSKRSFLPKKKTQSEKIDLNLATAAELEKVYGIGSVLSKRIMDYRDAIGGFSDDIQLQEVYGLSQPTILRVLEQFTVKTPKPLAKWDINSASASDLATIPGVSFDLAKSIWEFVRVREGIETLEELEKIEELQPYQLQRIQLYLSVQQPNQEITKSQKNQ